MSRLSWQRRCRCPTDTPVPQGLWVHEWQLPDLSQIVRRRVAGGYTGCQTHRRRACAGWTAANSGGPCGSNGLLAMSRARSRRRTQVPGGSRGSHGRYLQIVPYRTVVDTTQPGTSADHRRGSALSRTRGDTHHSVGQPRASFESELHPFGSSAFLGIDTMHPLQYNQTDTDEGVNIFQWWRPPLK